MCIYFNTNYHLVCLRAEDFVVCRRLCRQHLRIFLHAVSNTFKKDNKVTNYPN